MSTKSRSRLLELFKTRAFSFGNFTLASGKQSTYYINSKKAIFHSEAVALLGECCRDSTSDLDIQAIGGLEVGAIPMASGGRPALSPGGPALEGFFVRKQAKAHGSQERIEGAQARHARRLVDDVLTHGGSVLQAIEEVEKRGAEVVAVSLHRRSAGRCPRIVWQSSIAIRPSSRFAISASNPRSSRTGFSASEEDGLGSPSYFNTTAGGVLIMRLTCLCLALLLLPAAARRTTTPPRNRPSPRRKSPRAGSSSSTASAKFGWKSTGTVEVKTAPSSSAATKSPPCPRPPSSATTTCELETEGTLRRRQPGFQRKARPNDRGPLGRQIEVGYLRPGRHGRTGHFGKRRGYGKPAFPQRTVKVDYNTTDPVSFQMELTPGSKFTVKNVKLKPLGLEADLQRQGPDRLEGSPRQEIEVHRHRRKAG